MDSAISVCVAAYNEEILIGQCIKSILDQKGAEVAEILIGVNSSTDKTREIVQVFHKTDPRVRIVDSPKGKSNAWNVLNAAARNNLRIFQDGDCIAPGRAYAKLLAQLADNDIIGASIERNVASKSFIIRIINFPAKYIKPYPNLNGGLYLVNYQKLSASLFKNVGLSEMPKDIVNDDLFLQLIADKIRISEDVFIGFEPTVNIEEEVKRFVRIRVGNSQLEESYPRQYREKFILPQKKYSKIYQLLYLLKAATLREKILFPFVMFFKFIIFKYIHYKVNRQIGLFSSNGSWS